LGLQWWQGQHVVRLHCRIAVVEVVAIAVAQHICRASEDQWRWPAFVEHWLLLMLLRLLLLLLLDNRHHANFLWQHIDGSIGWLRILLQLLASHFAPVGRFLGFYLELRLLLLLWRRLWLCLLWFGSGLL